MNKVLVKSAWGSDDPTKAAFPALGIPIHV